jgi:hypothetical protein
LLKKIPLFLLIVLFLTSCQTKVLKFEGESEYWSVTVEVMQKGNEQKENVVIQYLDNENKSDNRREITYTYISKIGSGTGSAVIYNDMIEVDGISCIECELLTEEDEIIFTIEWEEKLEKFTLKSNEYFVE